MFLFEITIEFVLLIQIYIYKSNRESRARYLQRH